MSAHFSFEFGPEVSSHWPSAGIKCLHPLFPTKRGKTNKCRYPTAYTFPFPSPPPPPHPFEMSVKMNNQLRAKRS